ncbi:hypothetical protein OG618_14640 [Kitasatospora sp. NBC_01246]|uniref:hypothetical protein n=1 Tax=Kitasatospora sp. NBC_01246 TaxID=2903570 RepID=UPI002E35CC3C|nr:hypothetical protein [Kitasatospora sp. NBC_01246]
MPRPTTAQFCLGTCTVVAAAVALLAVSGATGVLEIAVLVGFALALGTLVTLLSLSTAAQRRTTATAGTTATPGAAHLQADAPAPAGHAYARQR